MSKLSLSTDAILLILHALSVSMPDDIRIGLTKPTTLYPDTQAMIFVKTDARALYVHVGSRFSVSGNEFVVKFFQVLDFSSPGTDPSVLYVSPDYTTAIHTDDFLEAMAVDVDDMITILKKELGV